MGSISGGFEYNRQLYEERLAAMARDSAQKRQAQAAAAAEHAREQETERALTAEYGPRFQLWGRTWADRLRAELAAAESYKSGTKGLLETAFGGFFSRWKTGAAS